MKSKEMVGKHSITKKTKILIVLQIMMILAAFVISLFGVFESLQLASSINRLIVYGGQAAICLAALVLGVNYSKCIDFRYFKILVIGYALVEAVRVALLQTGEIAGIYSFLAKLILALLVLGAALLSEKLEKKEGQYMALAMTGMEILLYFVYLVGFPAVRTSVLYMVFPLVGILISGSMYISIKVRSEQVK